MPDTGNTAYIKLLCAAIVLAYLFIASPIVSSEEAHITGESDITVSSVETASDNLTLTITATTGERFVYDLVSQSEALYRQGLACHNGDCAITAMQPQPGERYHILYDRDNRIRAIAPLSVT